jgi:hypothetical protein
MPDSHCKYIINVCTEICLHMYVLIHVLMTLRIRIQHLILHHAGPVD